MHASVLSAAGKHVIAWTERDTPRVRATYEKLLGSTDCSLVASHSPDEDFHNLEASLAHGCQIEALTSALAAIADDRGYDWDVQRRDLLSRAEHLSSDEKSSCSQTESLEALISSLSETQARTLILSALSASKVTPFSIKGGRHARILTETVVASQGIPNNFLRLLQEIEEWVQQGCMSSQSFEMPGDQR